MIQKLASLLNLLLLDCLTINSNDKKIIRIDKTMQEEALNRTESVLAEIDKILNKIPVSDKIKDSIYNIRSSIQVLRPPRIMLIGRSGSGKSSLINAICGLKLAEIGHTKPTTGKAEWKTYYHGGTDVVRLLDTRGFQESEAPQQQDRAKTSFESIKNAIKQEYPDIILFVSKAVDVRSAIAEDLNLCGAILQEIKKIHAKYELSVIAVLTHCDQVAPPKSDLNNEKKQQNIQEYCDLFANDLKFQENIRPYFKEVIPTVTYAEYEEGDSGLILPETDWPWNIDKLIETMMKYTPQERRGSFARMGHVKKTQLTIAQTITASCAVLTGFLASHPIPGASIAPVIAVQTFMVMYIGWLSGRDFSQETVKDLLVTGGIAAGTNAGIMALTDVALKFIPGVGSVVSAIAGASATQGIGDVAIAYFLKQDQ